MPNNQRRRRDSARLTWSSKPRRAPNPKDIDFQTAEIVIPNPQRDQLTIAQFRKLAEYEIDKGDNMLAMAQSKNPVIYHRGERRARRVLRLFQSLLRFSGAFAFSVCSAVNFKDLAISLEKSTVPLQ